MEGAPRTLTPLALPIPDLPQEGWEIALVAPGTEVAGADQPLTLEDGQGVVFVRR
jgi:hypothetical protein